MDGVGFLFGVVDLEYACFYLVYLYGVEEGCVEVVFAVYAYAWRVFVCVSYEGVAVGVGVFVDEVVGECDYVWCVPKVF